MLAPRFIEQFCKVGKSTAVPGSPGILGSGSGRSGQDPGPVQPALPARESAELLAGQSRPFPAAGRLAGPRPSR